MINFFRKIRQRLLTENKVSKYLLYAIGEIVLVMVGILLALQVNNWNEESKNTSSEIKTMMGLVEEFKINHARLTFVIDRKQLAENALRNYLKTITSDSLSQIQKSKFHRPDYAGFNWTPSYSILNSSLSTGMIDHFKNDSLKHLLTGWNDYVSDYKEIELMFMDKFVPELLDIENENIPAKIFKKGSHELTPSEYIQTTDTENFRLNIISKLNYQNAIAGLINWLHINLFVGNSALERSTKIREHLEKEINARTE